MRYPSLCIPRQLFSPLLILFTLFTSLAAVPLYAEDLILDGSDVMFIENQTYTHTGNIYIRGNAKLVVRNATLIINISYHSEFDIYVSDNARLECYASSIKAGLNGEGMGITMTGSSVLFFKDCNLEDGSIGIAAGVEGGSYGEDHLFTGNITISNSKISMLSFNYLPEGGGVTSVVDSYVFVLTLRFLNSFRGELSNLIPGLFTSWSYSDHGYDISLTNTKVESFIAACDGPSQVTVRNCEFHQFGFTAPSSEIAVTAVASKIRQVALHGLRDIKAQFWSLKACHHEDFVLSDHSAVTRGELPFLRLRNTDVTELWLVNVFNNSEITIDDSTLEFRMYLENSYAKVTNSKIYNFMLYMTADSTAEFNKTSIDCIDVYVPPVSATIKGNINFPSNATLSRWYGPSVVTRRYPVACGVPSASMKLYNRNGVLVWSGHTNSAGRGEFPIQFTDDNHSDVWKLRVSYGGKIVDTAVHLLTSTPIILTGQFPPPPPAPKVTPTPAVILLLGE